MKNEHIVDEIVIKMFDLCMLAIFRPNKMLSNAIFIPPLFFLPLSISPSSHFCISRNNACMVSSSIQVFVFRVLTKVKS